MRKGEEVSGRRGDGEKRRLDVEIV